MLLSSEDVSLVVQGSVIVIGRDCVEPDPTQIRKEFDPEKMQELADSIAAVGQLIPVLIKLKPGFIHQYVLVDGERRWRACGMVGFTSVKAIVVEGDEVSLLIHQVIANCARQGHSPLELARAIAAIKSKTGESSVQVARYFGQSQGWVDQHLSLLRLPQEVQRLMSPPYPVKKRINLSVALLLVSLPSDEQVRLAHEFHANGTKFSKAKYIVEQLRNKLQVVGQREVEPRHQLAKLSRFLTNLVESSELLLGMPMSTFDDMFRNRSAGDIADMCSTIGGCIENLESLQQVIQRIQAQKQSLNASE